MTHERRIGELERAEEKLSERVAEIAVLKTQITSMGREIGELKLAMREGFARVDARFDRSDEKNAEQFADQSSEMKATRRTTMAFAYTVAGACLTTLLTLLATGVI